MIKNIIFDIGNVIVQWRPEAVIANYFPQLIVNDVLETMKPAWIDLNLGTINEDKAASEYQNLFSISKAEVQKFLDELKTTQIPIEGSFELLNDLKMADYPLYSITDNTKEIIAYHKEHSDFLQNFIDVIVSADLGILKPDPKIFQHLLDKHQLNPQECVFIDDTLMNVTGAQACGLEAIQFTNAQQCREALIKLGVLF